MYNELFDLMLLIMRAGGFLFRVLVAGIIAFGSFSDILSQDQPQQKEDSMRVKMVVIKNDGSSFTGYIITRDEREMLIETESLGRIYIPLYEVKEIIPYEVSGRGSTLFSTRYFLTTNGLSMKKGDRYAVINYYGPEAHFAVAENFSLGIMTTWFAMPIVGSAKYSFSLNGKTHLAIGLLAGTLSWAELGSAGILGYGSITFGDYNNNLTLSGGWAGITTPDGGGNAPLLSPSCLVKAGRNIYFLVDTFIYLGEGDNKFGIIVPGLRFIRPQRRSSIQFGFAAVAAEGDLIPAPMPVISWFFEL